MSGFSNEWLALREAVDTRSRSASLARQLRAGGARGTKRIIDLGTGNAANLRYLAPRLGGAQDWLLVDDDGLLLDAVERELRSWAVEGGLAFTKSGGALALRGAGLSCRVHRVQMDLARDLHRLSLDKCWLVTASALLDLVTPSWLDALLARCQAAAARLLFALTYDGVSRCRPALPEDALINALVNRHQSRDKGFGSALGPRAARVVPGMIQQYGYAVTDVHTPWRIGPAQAPLQRALIEGWAHAAIEEAPEQAAQIHDWRRRRQAYVAAGKSHLQVGHRDVLALPVTGGTRRRPDSTSQKPREQQSPG